METGNSNNVQSRREYSRVDVYIPMDFRLVRPEDRQRVKSHLAGDAILAEFRGLPAIEDSLTVEWLTILNSKLDTIIRMLTFDHEGFIGLPYVSANISGGGMKFDSPQAYAAGDVLEVRIMLSAPRRLALYIYGEVTKSEQKGDVYSTAIKYILMDDAIRNEIIQFVFEREREILRERRRSLF
jgi:hypothetical protein